MGYHRIVLGTNLKDFINLSMLDENRSKKIKCTLNLIFQQ